MISINVFKEDRNTYNCKCTHTDMYVLIYIQLQTKDVWIEINYYLFWIKYGNGELLRHISWMYHFNLIM
jgi:hypothetical protein